MGGEKMAKKKEKKERKAKVITRKLSPELQKAMKLNAKAQVAIHKQIEQTQARFKDLQNRFIAEARAAVCITKAALKNDEEVAEYDAKTGIVTCQKKKSV